MELVCHVIKHSWLGTMSQYKMRIHATTLIQIYQPCVDRTSHLNISDITSRMDTFMQAAGLPRIRVGGGVIEGCVIKEGGMFSEG